MVYYTKIDNSNTLILNVNMIIVFRNPLLQMDISIQIEIGKVSHPVLKHILVLRYRWNIYK